MREPHGQQADEGSSYIGEPIARASAAGERAQPDLTSALAGSTAVSRATSAASIADDDAGSAARNPSLRQSTRGPDAAALPDARRCFTVNDTAQMLSISRSTIYKLIKSNILQTIKVFGRRLVIRDSVEKRLKGDE